MNWIEHLFSDIVNFFKSPKVKAAFATVEQILPIALSVVQDLATTVPNKTLVEINAAAQKYGQQVDAALVTANPGLALLNLATSILAAKLPGTATNIIQTAIQIAVTTIKAGA